MATPSPIAQKQEADGRSTPATPPFRNQPDQASKPVRLHQPSAPCGSGIRTLKSDRLDIPAGSTSPTTLRARRHGYLARLTYSVKRATLTIMSSPLNPPRETIAAAAHNDLTLLSPHSLREPVPVRVTLSDALTSGEVPILDPYGGGSTSWRVGGTEALTDAFQGKLREIAQAREWHPDTLVWVSSSPITAPGTSTATGDGYPPHMPGQPVSARPGFLGYFVSLLEPGSTEVRPASMSTWGDHGRVGMTPSEFQADWQANHQLTTEQKARLDVAEKRRNLEYGRKAAQLAEAELRDSIRSAIDAGVPVAEIAGLASLSRERVYQIRDGRR